MKPLILLVDDQESIRYFLTKTLARRIRLCRLHGTGRGDQQRATDLVLLDLKLPDRNGLEVLAEIHDISRICVVMMIAFGDIKTAVEAASSAPTTTSTSRSTQLLLVIRAWRQELSGELLRLRRRHNLDADERHPSQVLDAGRLQDGAAGGAQRVHTVLIEGESGTGKDVVAHLIHKMSARHNMPMMEINCALPEELLESELFATRRARFTDAKNQKLGLMELANAALFRTNRRDSSRSRSSCCVSSA